MLVLEILLFSVVFANALEQQHRAPSSIYMRTLLGRNRVELPSINSDRALPGEDVWPLLAIRGHNFTDLRSKMVTQSELDCLRDMETILSAAFPGKNYWAFKYIDAWAKPPAGIMQGNYAWYGDFDECLAIEPVSIADQNVTIRPQFCHIGLTPFNNANNGTDDETIFQFNTALMFGMCVSTTCDENTLSLIISDILPASSGLHIAHSSTHCQLVDPPLTKYTYIAIGVCVAFGFFMIIGFVLDVIIRFYNWAISWQKSATANSSLTSLVFGDGVANLTGYSNLLNHSANDQMIVRHRNLARNNNNHNNESNNADVDPIAADICDGDSASLVLPIAHTNNGTPAHGIERPGLETSGAPVNIQNEEVLVKLSPANSIVMFVRKLTRVLVCFSPYTNLAKLFTFPSHSETIPNLSSLHALRALSVFWVILGHCYVFLIGAIDNIWSVMDWSKRFTFQFIVSGIFAVDSFFFLSGFFAYWSLSRSFNPRPTFKAGGEQQKRDRFWFWKSLPFVYLHRFLRIAPPYLAVIMIDACLWAHLSNGPFYFQGIDMICVKNWWKNLLFVNNFMPLADQCVGWGWYLAVDMQLFLFAPFFVILFVWRPRLGWISAVLALLGQAAVATTLTYVKDLPSSLFTPAAANKTMPLPDGNPDDSNSYFADIYMKPYCRLGPYVVGIMVGHIVVQHSLYLTRNLFTRPFLTSLLWLLCISTMVAIIYGQFGINSGHYVNPRYVDAFYNSFARTAWGIALGWLVIALVVNRAGPASRILSWPGWALPARLSYAAYLTHPLVLIFFVQTLRRPFHATDLTMIFFFCGTLVVGFIVSTLFSLVFESPIIGMQRLGSSSGAAIF